MNVFDGQSKVVGSPILLNTLESCVVGSQAPRKPEVSRVTIAVWFYGR